jgi:hypothetical protein
MSPGLQYRARTAAGQGAGGRQLRESRQVVVVSWGNPKAFFFSLFMLSRQGVTQQDTKERKDSTGSTCGMPLWHGVCSTACRGMQFACVAATHVGAMAMLRYAKGMLRLSQLSQGPPLALAHTKAALSPACHLSAGYIICLSLYRRTFQPTAQTLTTSCPWGSPSTWGHLCQWAGP